MRTLIVSDLHLGATSGADLLRRAGPRAALLAELDGADRLVLLGDVLELRHGPRREALAGARAFFEDLGRAFGGREVVVSAGNHDHALVEPWLQRRGEEQAPPALGPEQRLSAEEASPMLATLAQWARPAQVTVAYPGLWVRPDVYATHGHYLDCHLTVPTMEGVAIGAMGRMLHRPARRFAGAEDYEAVMGPVFAWIDAVARQARTGNTLNGVTTVRAWRALGGGGDGGGGRSGGGAHDGDGDGDRGPPGGPGAALRTRALGAAGEAGTRLRRQALGGAFRVAVAALNTAGLGGPFRADISSGELRRAGLRAMGEVAGRLGLGDAHVIFGHTHRTGPLRYDRDPQWTAPCGARLMNAGCWTYDSYFLTATPGESPYWPGGCVVVEDDGPPVLKRLLADWGHGELAP